MEHWSELVDNLLTSDFAKALSSHIIHENEAKVTSLDPIGAVQLADELHLDPAPPILRPVLFSAISAKAFWPRHAVKLQHHKHIARKSDSRQEMDLVILQWFQGPITTITKHWLLRTASPKVVSQADGNMS